MAKIRAPIAKLLDVDKTILTIIKASPLDSSVGLLMYANFAFAKCRIQAKETANESLGFETLVRESYI